MSYRYPGLTHQITGNTSGATAQISSGTMWLSGGNNITLSQNGNTVEVIAAAAAGVPVNFSAGTTSGNLGSVIFSNSNGMSFGLNGSTITASHNGLTSQSNQAVSAANGSFTFQTATFANSNGVSFSTGTQGIFATVRTDYLTSQSNQALSGSNGSFTFQTATFGSSNGMHFYTTNGSVVGSYTVPTITNSSWTVSDAATSGSVARLAFTNLNGVTLSLSSGAGGSHTIVGSHNALTSQSNQALSGSNGSFTFQTATFGNLNGMSFYSSNGSMVGSYTVPSVPAQTNQTIGIYGSSQTTGQSSSSTYDARSLTFRGAGIISVGNSGGEVIISATGGGAGDGYNILAAGTQTAGTASTVVFSNSNGISFGMSNSSIITAIYTVPTQTNQTLGLYAVSNTTQSSSGTVDARTLSFHGAGIASVGVSNGSVVISVPAGGGAGDGYNILAAGTQTANTTGTVLFQDGNNVTFGMNNSSVITASVAPNYTLSDFAPPHAWSGRGTNSSLGQNTLYFMPFDLPQDLSASRINFYPVISASLETGNSTGSGRMGIGYGIYTRGTGASTERISLLSSYSMTFLDVSNSSNTRVSITHAFGLSNATSHSTFQTTFGTSNASTYVATNLNGHRAMPMPLNLTMTPGRYYLGVIVSRTATSAFANSLSMHITSVGVQPEVRGLGYASAATNASVFRGLQGLGSYSATTNAFPNSIALSTDNIRAGVNQTLIHFDIKGYGYSSNVL